MSVCVQCSSSCDGGFQAGRGLSGRRRTQHQSLRRETQTRRVQELRLRTLSTTGTTASGARSGSQHLHVQESAHASPTVNMSNLTINMTVNMSHLTITWLLTWVTLPLTWLLTWVTLPLTWLLTWVTYH